MAMVGETIESNLDTNIKMRYAQYIDKFINVYFQKTDQEETMSKKEQSVFRWRLRQVKNVFLEGNRNDIPKTPAEIKQFIQRRNTEILQDDSNGSLNIAGKIKLLWATNDYVEGLFRDKYFIDVLFPPSIDVQNANGVYKKKVVKSLLKSVREHPQSFIKSAIQINNYLESEGASAYNVIPIVRHVTPGFFEIDTQGLWGILRSTLSTKQVNVKKKMSEWNTKVEIEHMSPVEQKSILVLLFQL
ncbi:hypothetical protein GEMRC1_011630 [Eukaryota sp. GEM-RC1]